MANPFLNTARTVTATSNPETNINKLGNINQTQVTATSEQIPVVNNQVSSIGNPEPVASSQVPQINQTSTINPITIPIQLQPQIAQPVNNIQSLQTSQNNSQNVRSSAPTPQIYNNSSSNQKVIDFNQIYSSYQGAYGNNNTNINLSGIKKTSVGTTIVTPTVSNINTVKGQYQSAYSNTINSLISEMLTKMNTGFQYDPTQDEALKVATEYAANNTMQSLAGSGVLNSSATAERVARIVSELIPQYEEKAHDRWIEYLGQLADTAQIVMNYDSQQFQYWKDAKDREFEEKEFAFKKEQQELENAWKRVDELGYVDNNASALLGIKAGTLSKEARMAKEEREFELQKMREQAQLEYENNKALYKLRAELDLENEKALYKLKAETELRNEKELYQYKSNIDTTNNKELEENKYILNQKYGTTSNSNKNSNYSRYDEIIKNRYANYDSFSKQYVVSDEKTYQELGNYLDGLLASGQISETEFLQLSAKYSKYENSNSLSSFGNIKSSSPIGALRKVEQMVKSKRK